MPRYRYPIRFVILSVAIAIITAGCESAAPAPHAKSGDTLAVPASSAAEPGQQADPGLSYRKQQLKNAMRGLKYENETVTIDDAVAATIAQRGTRVEALQAAADAAAALEQNDQHAAIAGFTKAAIIDPTLASAYEGLGLGLYQRSKNQEAIAAYRKSIELDPRSISAMLKLADALDRVQRHDDAIAEWNEILGLDADNAEAHGKLAVAYYMAMDDARAWQHTNAAEQLGYELPGSFRTFLAERTPEMR